MYRKGSKKTKSHAKRGRKMRGGEVLGFDVKGITKTKFAELLDGGGPIVDVVKSIADSMARGSKPSDMLLKFGDVNLLKPGSGYLGSGDKVNAAFKEAVAGAAAALADKGMGYRRKRVSKKKHHKRK
jgi:hypothetical protein